MRRNADIAAVIMFAAFVFVLAALFVILPKEKTSVNEKRDLQSLPNVSLKTILNGKFESETEAYLTDHFPFRNSFAALNSYSQLAFGQNGVNGVYKGSDGYLINTPVTEDMTVFKQNISAVKQFAQSIDVPVSVLIVPTTGSVMRDKLPANHMSYPDDKYIDYAAEELSDTDFADMRKTLYNAAADGGQVYYKTDHHWTEYGAYLAYRELCENALDKSEFAVEAYDGFFGTTYSKSALWREKGESIELWTRPANMSVTISDGAEQIKSQDMFFREHLDELDKYPVYLDGNHSYVRIENKDQPSGRLLIIKDSYANCLAPFLALHNSITDMVDLRYYLTPVSELVRQEGYDRVLIVYGLSDFAEASDINVLE